MSAVGTVRLDWSGGEHDFCLAKSGHIFMLEAACGNSGIMRILRRLESDDWFLNDVRETIRIGMIGGGMADADAMAMVRLHVDGNPNGLAPSVLIAQRVLAAVVIGVPDDPVGKTPAPGAATGQVSTTTTAASDAQPSSELAPA